MQSRPLFPLSMEISQAIQQTSAENPAVYVAPYTIIRCVKGFFERGKDEYFIYYSDPSGAPNAMIENKVEESLSSSSRKPKIEYLPAPDCLGGGASSIVMRGYRVNPSTGDVYESKMVAIKYFKESGITTDTFARAKLENEALKSLRRTANLVKFNALNSEENTNIIIVTDYFSEPPLATLNEKTLKFTLSEKITTRSFSERIELICLIINKLQELHTAGYAHLDFVPSNLMVGDHAANIIDLGNARQFPDDESYNALEVPYGEYLEGTPFMRSPAQYAPKYLDQYTTDKMAQVGKKCDLYPLLLNILLILNCSDPLKDKVKRCLEKPKESKTKESKAVTTGVSISRKAVHEGLDTEVGYNLTDLCQGLIFPHPLLLELITEFSNKMQQVEYKQVPSLNEIKLFYATIHQLCQKVRLHEEKQTEKTFNYSSYLAKLFILVSDETFGDYTFPTSPEINQAICHLPVAEIKHSPILKELLRGDKGSLELAVKINQAAIKNLASVERLLVTYQNPLFITNNMFARSSLADRRKSLPQLELTRLNPFDEKGMTSDMVISDSMISSSTDQRSVISPQSPSSPYSPEMYLRHSLSDSMLPSFSNKVDNNRSVVRSEPNSPSVEPLSWNPLMLKR